MSSNTTLRSDRALELLAQLKQKVTQFAKAEEQLTREITTRRNGINRKYRTAIEQTESSLDTEIAETAAWYAGETERLKAFHLNRRNRIQRAHTKGLRTLAEKAQRAKEKYLGGLQYRHLNAERKMPADLKAADEMAASFREDLQAQEARLNDLEKRARKAFGGYGSFLKLLRPEPAPVERTGPDHHALFETLGTQLFVADGKIAEFRERLLPRFFSTLPLGICVLFILLAGVVLAFALGFNPRAFGGAAGTIVALLVPVLVLHQLGQKRSTPAAEEIAATLAQARSTLAACAAEAADFHQREHQRIQAEYEQEWAAINEQWEKAEDVERQFARAGREKTETQALRIIAKNERTLGPRLERHEKERVARLEALSVQKETSSLDLRRWPPIRARSCPLRCIRTR
ncbi:MAG: hypothetical protein EOP84_25760 [Verrucomicrobiaceae bacterium]|nr:MAG: hypothetical protein EOP84_25760 [Verrucomicrobiaceae bacterium]